MMHNKAKVILTILAITFILSGCSLFLHLDGSSKENRKSFRTGKPTNYESKRLMLVSRMKKEREQEIIENRDRVWLRDDTTHVAIRIPDDPDAAPDESQKEMLAASTSRYESLSEPTPIAKASSIQQAGSGTKAASSGGPVAIGAAGSTTGIWTEPTTAMALVTFVDPKAAPTGIAATTHGPRGLMVKSPITVAALWGTDAKDKSISPDRRAKTRQSGNIRIKSPVTVAALWGTGAKGRPTPPDRQEKTPQSNNIKVKPPVAAVAHGTPRLKVVSGDGLPLSAKMMSGKLDSLGYTVEMIDVAPFEFDKPTVFYAPGFSDNARQLASQLKADGGTRPISWDSVFDIIVISVNTPVK